jgi:basic membrane protein A
LLLVQAGASPGQQVPRPTPSFPTASCTSHFRVAFVADVAGLRSTAEAQAYRGLLQALAGSACTSSELINSRRPSDYVASLEAVSRRNDLVVAGSFLLSDAVVQVAQRNRKSKFVLLDPIVNPPAFENLAVLRFRRDQGAFLAGALAALLTRSGIVAGVYGPGGPDDQTMRDAFEAGAAFQRPGIMVLGAYQPADQGEPYNDPAWGAAQAGWFAGQGADVIFGSGGETGRGALNGAAQAGIYCIATELSSDPARPRCVAASVEIDVSLAMQILVQKLETNWQSGTISLGVKEKVLRLDLFGPAGGSAFASRLDFLAGRLMDGSLSSGR